MRILLNVKVAKDLVNFDGDYFFANTVDHQEHINFCRAFTETHLFHLDEEGLAVDEGLILLVNPEQDYYRIIVLGDPETIEFTIDELW